MPLVGGHREMHAFAGKRSEIPAVHRGQQRQVAAVQSALAFFLAGAQDDLPQAPIKQGVGWDRICRSSVALAASEKYSALPCSWVPMV